MKIPTGSHFFIPYVWSNDGWRDSALFPPRHRKILHEAILDEILERHVEQSQSAEEIIAQGFDEPTVRRVLRLVRIAEFKRTQAAPGLKVTSRAFGTGWRMPIARGGE